MWYNINMGSIAEYIEKEGIRKIVEDVVNRCARERAKHALTYMANDMIRGTKSEVLGIRRVLVMDMQGVPSMGVEVTTHKGVFEGYGARMKSTSTHQRDPEYRDGSRDEYGGQHVKGLLVEAQQSTMLRKLCDIRDEDQHLRASTRYVNERLPLSVALCKANANEKGLSVHAYIHKHLMKIPEQKEMYMPRLVFEVYNIPDIGIVYVCPLDADLLNVTLPMAYRVTKDLHNSTRNGLHTLEQVMDHLFQQQQNHGMNLFEMGVKIQTDGTWYDERRGTIHLEYIRWIHKYGNSLLFIEDPFDEDEAYAECMKRVRVDKDSNVCSFVWSRYIASDIERLGKWLSTNHGSATRGGVCVRLHETGLVTDVVDAIRLAKEASNGDIMVMLSLETEGYDGNPEIVADLAIGTQVPFLNVGRIDSPQGSAAINTLIRSFR